MSASTKKKLRKEQNEEKLTQRQLQEQKEAKKNKLITTLFIVGLALILVAFIGFSIYNHIVKDGVIGSKTTVATVGEHKLSLTEFNYYYVDAVSEITSQISSTVQSASEYGSTEEEALQLALSMIGAKEDLDITKPMSELIYDETTGETWADHMIDEALAKAQRNYALYDAAKAAGFKLSDEDQTTLDSIPNNLNNYAQWSGYGNAALFMRKAYGYGEYATVESYVDYMEVCMIADAYYAQYSEDITYDDETLRKQEGETPEDYNSYSYAYYTVNVDQYLEGGTEVDGTTTYSDAEKEAARAKAEEVAKELITADSLESFNDKIAHTFTPDLVDHTHDEDGNKIPKEEDETEDEADPDAETEPVTDDAETEPVTEDTEEEAPKTPATSIYTADTLHTASKTEFRQWLAKADTVSGSATILPVEKKIEKTEDTTEADAEKTDAKEDATAETEITGYYAVYLVKKSENKTPEVAVRHLLVKVEEGATEEEWAAAKTEAEKLLSDWKAGEATEESFHTLVHDNTDDEGSKETGGLYENIHETSGYVDNFLAWCVNPDRTVGETEIVETEYGYHIMYFVNREEMSYRDQMISDKLRVTDTADWLAEITEKTVVTEKNIKKIDKDMVSLQYQ